MKAPASQIPREIHSDNVDDKNKGKKQNDEDELGMPDRNSGNDDDVDSLEEETQFEEEE